MSSKPQSDKRLFEPAPALDRPRGARVLIVDDDLRDAEILARTLKVEGFEIFIASGGEMALRLLERHPYDLVILDVKMPDMDGREVARRARKIAGHVDTPILFLSGHTDPEKILEAFRAGGCDFVSKPFSPGELVARVRVHVKGGAWQSGGVSHIAPPPRPA